MYFLSFRILNNLGLPWKTEFALKFFTVLNIVFTFRIFEQLVLALKNSVPWIHCRPIEYIFFYHSEFWTTCACPEKQYLPWNLSLYWNIFYLSGFLSNLSLPWKQSLPWIFQAGGAASLPAPSPRAPLVMTEIRPKDHERHSSFCGPFGAESHTTSNCDAIKYYKEMKLLLTWAI